MSDSNEGAGIASALRALAEGIELGEPSDTQECTPATSSCTA
jgi:hypothetical protein